MNKFWALTRVLIKNNYGKAFSSKKGIFGTIALCLCMLPMMFLVYMQIDSFFDLGMKSAGIEFGLLLICGITLLTVFFSFPSMLYFSDDTARLMAMPLPAWTIVWSKTVMIFLSALVLNLTVAIPFFACALIDGAVDWIGALLLLIAIPAILASVLFLLGILFILVMKIMPRGLTKNGYNLFSSMLAIVLSLGLSIAIQAQAGSSDSVNLIDPAAFSLPTGPFFQINLAAEGIVQRNGLAFSCAIAFCVLSGFVYHFVAHKFYLKTAAAVSSATSGQKKSRKNVSYKKSSAFVEMMKVETRELVRTPAYLMNAVAGCFVGPILITLMMLFVPSFQELRDMLSGFVIPSDVQLTWGFIAGGAFSLFLGGSNMISVTAVSRKGINGVKFMKSIPMRISDQLMSTCVVGFLFSTAASLLYLIPVKMLMTTPLSFDLAFVLGILLLSWLINISELCLDLIHPKLVWDNETTLMKNNYNSMLCLFAFWGYLGIGAVLYFVLNNITMTAWIFGLFTLLVCGLLTWQMPKLAASKLKNLS